MSTNTTDEIEKCATRLAALEEAVEELHSAMRTTGTPSGLGSAKPTFQSETLVVLNARGGHDRVGYIAASALLMTVDPAAAVASLVDERRGVKSRLRKLVEDSLTEENVR